MIDGLRRVLTIRFTRKHVEREIDDELAFHIERRAEQLMAAGMPADAARAEARRRFGDVSALRDECLDEDLPDHRRQTVRDVIDQTASDVKFALRSLRRSPWFTAVSLTTLVLGIASVTAIFSFIYSFYWRPLPYAGADRIISVHESRADHSCCMAGVSRDGIRMFRDARSFDRIALFDEQSGNSVVNGEPRQLSLLGVDTSFAPLFRLRPQLGRFPSPEEFAAHAAVVAISDELWRAAYGGDSSVLHARLQLGTEAIAIVGVLPPGFGFPRHTDAIRPLAAPENDAAHPDRSALYVLAHLRPGESRANAAAEARTLAARFAHDPSVRSTPRFDFDPEMLDRRANQALPLPSLFIGASVFLLLIACSNVMNLMLVRAAERRGELAVRASLGASRWRLIRQTMTEVLAVAIIAGLLGSAASIAVIKVGLALLPTHDFPGWLQFGFDGRILAFTLALVLLVTIAVGLTPARDGTRFDLSRALKIGGDAGVVSTGVGRAARRGLVVQLALSIALFVGATLFVQSYRRMTTIDFGYPAEEIGETLLFYDLNRYETTASRLALANQLAEALRAPGTRVAVHGVAAKPLLGPESMTPISKRNDLFDRDARVIPDGDTTRAVNEYFTTPRIRMSSVGDEYFDVLGLKLMRGRGFSRADGAGTTPVVVVSEHLARMLWPKSDPVGHTLRRGTGPEFTVIGVVQSVRDMQGGRGGFKAEPSNDAFFSSSQVETWYPGVTIHDRLGVPAAKTAVTAALRKLDPQLTSRVGPMGGASEARTITRVFGGVIATFAVAGLILSVIGLYGVIAYGVDGRVREIGVRIALGATGENIIRMIVGQSLRFVGFGLAGGILLAMATGRLLQRILFEVSAAEPIAYVAALALFGAVALIACYFPARRAAAINPVTALKSD